MEETFSLESTDEFLIHGIFNSRKKTNKLIIFVHGLTGEKENHLYYNGARFFPKRGIDTVRFDLFSNETHGRTLTDCSLSHFSSDLNQVIKQFSLTHSEIHIIGHSIGGCVAINANQDAIKSLILWDTALAKQESYKEPLGVSQHNPEANKNQGPFIYDAYLDKYLAHLKIQYLLSKQLIEERAQQDERILKKIQRPLRLIFAGNTKIRETWENRLQHIPTHFVKSLVEHAGHGFNEYGVNKVLFQQTLEWIEHEHKAFKL